MIILGGAIESPEVKVNHDACDLCANCVRTCPMGVLKIRNRKVVQTEAICIGCRNCKVSCRPSAIEVTGQHRPLEGRPPIGYFPIPATPPYRGIHPNKSPRGLPGVKP